jgi:hypothetical protein
LEVIKGLKSENKWAHIAWLAMLDPEPFKFAACWRKAFSTLAGSRSLKIVRIEVCAGDLF